MDPTAIDIALLQNVCDERISVRTTTISFFLSFFLSKFITSTTSTSKQPDPVVRLQHAFDAAEQHMAVFELLEAADVAQGKVDEISIITYLVDFLKWWNSEARIAKEISRGVDGSVKL
jgi:hypothetical protein